MNVRAGQKNDRSIRNVCTAAIALLASGFVAIAVIGVVARYSPTPFWDMWDGEIEFFTKVQDGDWRIWFAQHNEHRIVLSRVLFLMDLSLFGGVGVFPRVANYLIVLGSFVVFLAFLRDRLRSLGSHTGVLIGAMLAALCFSWVQENNLTWGFQSQFFLAQVLPLAALYFLHRAERVADDRYLAQGWRAFATSCFLGVAAAELSG